MPDSDKPPCTHPICNKEVTGHETQAEIEQVLACMVELGKVELIRYDEDGEPRYRLVQ